MRWVVLQGCALAIGLFSAANAQENDVSGQISVELNAAQTIEASCTLSFLITNGLKAPVERLIYETVLFDTNGQVSQLTLFDFGALPVGRPRVRQFALPDLSCDQLGRVLFNETNTCDGAGLTQGACSDVLAPSSRTTIEVIG